MEIVGGAWKRKNYTGEYLSVRLDRGYNGAQNVMVFPNGDEFRVVLPLSPGKYIEVGTGVKREKPDGSHHFELTLLRGLDGDPIKVFLLPNKRIEGDEKRGSSREPDYNVCRRHKVVKG